MSEQEEQEEVIETLPLGMARFKDALTIFDTPKHTIKDIYLKDKFAKTRFTFTHVTLKVQGQGDAEIHHEFDKLIRVERGKGWIFIKGKGTEVGPNTFILIPADTHHFFLNTSDTELVYTSYAPGKIDRPKELVEKAVKAKTKLMEEATK